MKAARKPDLTVLLMCDQLDYAISIRFQENGFTSDPHTRSRATPAKAQPLTRGLDLKPGRDYVLSKCVQGKSIVFKPIEK